MSILFLLRSLDIGGLEVVTATLANKFAVEGHCVSVFAFERRSGNVLCRFGEDVNVVIAGEYRKTAENVRLLRQMLVERKVDVVINQWGLPLVPIKTLCEAKRGIDVKVISVYHNDPLQNGRIQSVEAEIAKTLNPVKKFVLEVKKLAYRCVTGYAMRYNYRHSDVFEVLSPSFVSHFQKFIWLKETPKVVVQTNPITINIDGFDYNPDTKRKEIIYVGRIDYTQKRVHRVVESWAQLDCLFPEWQLRNEGEGHERGNIEHMAKDLELKHVNFEGFQAPRPYYERASMLILTSEFEGFPLVLAECMSFGVVPVVYGSYSAVYDIIEDGKDGIIVRKKTEGFNAVILAECIKNLIKDEKRLDKMALAAIDKSSCYSINKIYEQWMGVFRTIK